MTTAHPLELTATVTERDVDVSLDVAPGETTALLGRNGSGKSTVLAVAAGLLRPDRGRVILGDRVLTDVGPGRPGVHVATHARRIAMLVQDALLFPHLSALDNVAFGPRSTGNDRHRSRTTAQEWLDRLGVGELADRRPGQLSGGEAQRVAVARALAAQPQLLLLDEPMAALDVAVLPSLRQMLRKVLEHRTAVVVTHDPLDALLLADRVAVLEGGRIVESGTSREVLARPRSAFAARLAGLNMLTGTWRDDAVHTSAGLVVHGQVQGDPPEDGDDVVVTFRPHAVAVYPTAAHGSPRNAFELPITDVEPLADLIRVHAGQIHADITVQAAAELHLTVGQPVHFVVKATETTVYRR